MKTVISATVLALASLVAGEAINCRGSAVCATDAGAQNAAQAVHDQIDKLVQEGSGDRHFATDELIACARGTSNSFCAFYQQGASGTAKQALDQVQQLINRGCKRCGSVKVNPQSAADGFLTVNYREKPCCEGNCHC